MNPFLNGAVLTLTASHHTFAFCRMSGTKRSSEFDWEGVELEAELTEVLAQINLAEFPVPSAAVVSCDKEE